jgi:hypothetical protein
VAVVSLRAYARHRGVTLAAVQKALATRRIQRAPDGGIDVEAADRDWSRNTEPLQQQNGITGGHAPKPGAAPIAQQTIAEPPPAAASSLAQSQSVRIAYQARLAKIEYEERLGKLVQADEVRAAAFRAARVVREQLLGLPDRLAPQLVGGLSVEQVHELLTTEIERVLRDLAASGPAPGRNADRRGGL